MTSERDLKEQERIMLRAPHAFLYDNYGIDNYKHIAPGILTIKKQGLFQSKFAYPLILDDEPADGMSIWSPVLFDNDQIELQVVRDMDMLDVKGKSNFDNTTPLLATHRSLRNLQQDPTYEASYTHNFGSVVAPDGSCRFNVGLVLFDLPYNFGSGDEGSPLAARLSALNWLYKHHKMGDIKVPDVYKLDKRWKKHLH
jgi:hypothetical protein